MQKITTESGALYLYDDVNLLVQRQEPYSHRIDYAVVPDGKWLALSQPPLLALGSSAVFYIAGGKYRICTYIVSIEEIDD
jgi:hypothetical protein